MSTTRIVATDVTRSLPVPNSKTFPMTGAARSVARQRKVSAASRKKISIKATRAPFGASFFIMCCWCAQVWDGRHPVFGCFLSGQAACVLGVRHQSTVPRCPAAVVSLLRTKDTGKERADCFPVYARCRMRGIIPVPEGVVPFCPPCSCPDRAAKRCLRSLTVLVSSKNTLFQPTDWCA